MMSWACRLSRALIVMSRSTRSPLISTRSTAPMSPPALPMTEVTRPSMPGLFRISEPNREAVGGAGGYGHQSLVMAGI